MTKQKQAAVPHTVRLRSSLFTKATKLAGFRSDYALAKAMGINRSTISRVVSGEIQPGPAFIAGALIAFAPMQFEDLFEVAPATTTSSSPTPETPTREAM